MLPRFALIVVACLLASPSRAEPQPHMRAALEHIEKAREQLKKATADKGGHRVKAIALLEEAEEQLRKGMAFDDKH